MSRTKFQSGNVQNNETSAFDFGTSIITAAVALQEFSGGDASCSISGISGSRVFVKASTSGDYVRVLVIAECDS